MLPAQIQLHVLLHLRAACVARSPTGHSPAPGHTPGIGDPCSNGVSLIVFHPHMHSWRSMKCLTMYQCKKGVATWNFRMEGLISVKLQTNCNVTLTLTFLSLHNLFTYIFPMPYLALALPWASKSIVGTPTRTNRVKRDCSMFEYFWKAMFLMTGGNWWWSPIIIHRFNRLNPSCGFC